MPVVMQLRWKGVTKDQYEQVRRSTRWETDVPEGAGFHVAAFDADGLVVVDVWQSEASFQTFMQQRLQAGVQAAGIQGEPRVEFLPVHAIFNPGTPPARSF